MDCFPMCEDHTVLRTKPTACIELSEPLLQLSVVLMRNNFFLFVNLRTLQLLRGGVLSREYTS